MAKTSVLLIMVFLSAPEDNHDEIKRVLGMEGSAGKNISWQLNR